MAKKKEEKKERLELKIRGMKFIMTGQDIIDNIDSHYSKEKCQREFYTNHDGGLYAIINELNGKYYIGSAVDIYRRWRDHIKEARSGTHHSEHFQTSWDIHSPENYKFYILKVFPKDRDDYIHFIQAEEQKLLNKYEPWRSENGYNVSKNAFTAQANCMEQLINGELAFDLVQYCSLVYYFTQTDEDLHTISDYTGVPYSLVKDIHNRRAYKSLFGVIEFTKREQHRNAIEHEWDTMLKLYNEGKNSIEIGESVHLSATQVARIFHKKGYNFSGQNKTTYVYDMQGNLLKSFGSFRETTKWCEVSLPSPANGTYVQAAEKYMVSYNSVPKPMTPIEQILGSYELSKHNPIVKMDLKHNPIDIFIKGSLLGEQRDGVLKACRLNTIAFGYYWKYAKDLTEEEIKQLAKAKKVKIKNN